MTTPSGFQIKKVLLPVDGMSCTSCSARIEKKVGELAGVREVHVNFGTGSAEVHFDSSSIQLLEVCRVVENLGFTVPRETVSFYVKGMSCGSFVSQVQKKITNIEGVTKVELNLVTEKATVEIFSNRVEIADFRSALSPMGFTVSLEVKEDSEVESKEKRRNTEDYALRTKVLLSALSAIIIIFSQINETLPPFALFLFATPVQFWAGWQFYVGTFKGLRHGMADMNALIVAGTSAAYLYSTFAITFPESLARGNVGLYFGTSVMIITLVLFGRFLEARARGKASEAIRKLIDLQPKTARVEKDGREIEIPVAEVSFGDVVCIRPGERVAVDGLILKGETSLDESMMTGESVPVEKGPADAVIGGTINKTGFLKIRAERLGRDSVLGQIVKAVKEAQGSRAPIQRLADLVAGLFVRTVIVIASMAFLFWWVFGSSVAILPISDFQFALTIFISVMIVACPCALGLATPAAIMVGTGKAAELGILIKGGEVLERIHRLDTVAFDKTGTLTAGKPRVSDVIVAHNVDFSGDDLLALAAAVEKGSEHPLAKAVFDEAQLRGLKISELSDFKALSGFGVRARITGCSVSVGSLKWVKQEGAKLGELERQAIDLAEQGKTPMVVSFDNRAVGVIACADKLKSHAQDAISALKQSGLKVILITGDNPQTAKAVADELGIEEAMAEVLPNAKARVIKELQEQGRTVALVGDGINDAPALAQADVGIALGAGADIAIEASDITLIRDDLNAVTDAISLSKKTFGTIRQNLFWTFFYNIVGIPIAAGVLYPFFGILLKPIYAALAMSLSSVSVVSNSLLLKRFRPSE